MTENSLREALIKIEQLIENSSITNHLFDQKDLETVLKNYSPKVAERLDECFVMNSSSQQITQLKWPKGLKVFTKMLKYSFIDQESLQKLVEQKAAPEKDCIETIVEVKFLELPWFFNQRKNFTAFATILNGLDLPISFY